MTDKERDIDYKLKVLLEKNPHENERYLACCTLLIQMQSSNIRAIVDQHSDFRSYIINLIRPAVNVSLEMKRMGVRILSLYLSEVENKNDGVLVETKDWKMFIEIFVKRCKDNEEIDMFDAELLHLIRIGIEKSNTVPLDMLPVLPDLMMERFCNGSNAKTSTDAEIDIDTERKTVKETETASQEIGMAFVLRKVLDGNYETSHSPFDIFGEAMIQYMAAYAGSLSSSENTVQNSSILTSAFVKRTTDILFAKNQNYHSSPISSHEYRCLLHYTLLEFISRDLARDQTREKGFSLQQTLAMSEDETLNASIQKLVLSGITSLLDATESINIDDAKVEKQKEVTKGVNVMIRTMTIQLLADLVESAEIKWMKSSSQGSLGDAGTLCMMTRLIAGELRIVMGSLVDTSLMLNDPDNDGKTKSAPRMDEGISQRCQACIRIGLFTLKTMLDKAIELDHREEHQNRPTISFNADSILHIRHTLEDYLDTCIQFLLEDINADAFEGWSECAFDACRYLGAYLSQVNVFDYDVLDDNDDEQENDEGDRKRTTTSNLLRAMSNGVAICHNLSKSSIGKELRNSASSEKIMTLFPSVLSTLTCCEDTRQTTLVRKYLFRNTLVSSLIVSVLDNVIVTGGRIESMGSLYASLDSISWCCLLIGAMIDFESMSYTNSATKIMNKENLMKVLISVSNYVLDAGKESMVLSEGTDVLNALTQLFDCWEHLASVVERTGCGDMDNSEMLRVRSFLQVNML